MHAAEAFDSTRVRWTRRDRAAGPRLLSDAGLRAGSATRYPEQAPADAAPPAFSTRDSERFALRPQAHLRGRHRLQRVLGSALAMPVLARVYAETAASRLLPTRPATLVVALVAGSMAAQLLVGSPATATPATVHAPVASTAFRAVTVPAERFQPVGAVSNARPLAMVADGGSLRARLRRRP